MKYFLFLAVILGSGMPTAADLETSGFLDLRYGQALQSHPEIDSETLNEVRLQLGTVWYHDLFTLTARADAVADQVTENYDQIDLENGTGPLDLREANVLFTPAPWADVKAGRQILTWGTGDLLFINDLFSKDWKSFFAGRDEEYLKAPSDAVFISLFPSWATIDIAYMPRFDADRYIDGERFAYWNGAEVTGDPLETDKPDSWFSDDEVSLRVYRTFVGWELAGYLYDGFWKSPQGFDPVRGLYTFPKLTVYGASARGALAGGIAHMEAGYYDSRESDGRENPLVPDSQYRLLAGYEHEILTDLTGAAQYYVEYGEHEEDTRHVLTVRLTQRLMNQNLTLGLFTYWSPSDEDGYLRPSALYKLTDAWRLEARGNLFFGKTQDTFFGQFEDSSNASLAVRYSF